MNVTTKHFPKESYKLYSGDLNGGWFQYTKEWEDGRRKYPESIYSVHYESLKRVSFFHIH